MGLRLVNWDGEKFNKRPARNNKNETLYFSLWNKPAKKHNLSIICDDGHNYSIVKLIVYKDLYSVAVYHAVMSSCKPNQRLMYTLFPWARNVTLIAQCTGWFQEWIAELV